MPAPSRVRLARTAFPSQPALRLASKFAFPAFTLGFQLCPPSLGRCKLPSEGASQFPHRVKGVAHPSPKHHNPNHRHGSPCPPLPHPSGRGASEGADAPGPVLLRRSPPTRPRVNLQPASQGAPSDALPAASVPEGTRERAKFRDASGRKTFARLGLRRLRRWRRVWGLRPPPRCPRAARPGRPRLSAGFSVWPPAHPLLSAPESSIHPVTSRISQPLGILPSDPQPPRVQSPLLNTAVPRAPSHRSSR